MTTPTTTPCGSPQDLPELIDAFGLACHNAGQHEGTDYMTLPARRALLAALAARQQAVPADPDWRELTRRLYVELFHCNRQMTTERRKWTAGACVLNALADAKAALEANPAPQQAPEPIEDVRAKLQDPVAVHVAMLRGEIAKPAIRDMLHAYGADALAQFDRGTAVQPTPALKRHALESAKQLSEYAAAPFFPDTDKRGKVRSTSADWWDGLAELIEESQPLINRALRECTEPATPAQAVESETAKDAARYRWLCENSFDREGVTQVALWLNTWEPHSQTGEPTMWTQRLRGPAIDRFIDVARAAQATGKEGE